MNRPFAFLAASAFVSFLHADYNPLAVSKVEPFIRDMTVKDEKRSREIPIKVYLPTETKPAPVVLFSHGLGGSREGSKFLGVHWAKRGFVAVFLQHPGSDAGVWKDQPVGERTNKLKGAANLENFRLRVEDVPAVLDELEKWNAEGQPLAKRLDLTKVGMAGHSFGAVTTQAVSGQEFLRVGKRFTDLRIRAAVVMSPSGPRNAMPAKSSFGNVKIPWLLMTGTKDDVAIFKLEADSRLSVFPALPPGDKYELVLKDAEHSVFTDHKLPGERGQRNPKHHAAILAISTAFWDAHLNHDPAAKAWLDGDGVKAVLDKEDGWKRK
jgi:predicted dienelactone hydrolase